MYQLNELIALINPYVGLIGSGITILLFFKSLFDDKGKQATHQTTYQQCNVDNRSVNLSSTVNYTAISNSTFCNVNYYYNPSYTVRDVLLDMRVILPLIIFFTLAFWRYVEILRMIVMLYCFFSLSLMFFFAKRSTAIKAHPMKKRQMYLYLFTLLLCFSGLAMIDPSLPIKLESVDSTIAIIEVVFSMVGMGCIPCLVFRPFSKTDRAFCRFRHYKNGANAIVSQITVSLFPPLLCSGLLYQLVSSFSDFMSSLSSFLH